MKPLKKKKKKKMRHCLSLVLIGDGKSDARSERSVGQQRLPIENSVIPEKKKLEQELTHSKSREISEKGVSKDVERKSEEAGLDAEDALSLGPNDVVLGLERELLSPRDAAQREEDGGQLVQVGAV
jgi:hypothetical protein